MKRPVLYLPLVVALAAWGLRAVHAGPGEDAKLTALFKEYLEDEFRQRPLEATRLGDHRFDHLLDDVSPKARAAWTQRVRKTLDDLPKRVAFAKLSAGSKVDYKVFEDHLKRSLWLAENTNRFEDDPRVYNDYITESVYLLLTQSTLPKATNVKNCIARMALIPRVVAAAKEGLKEPPRVFVETAINQNRGAIAFYESGIYELSGESPQLSDLARAAKPVVASLKAYQKFLEAVLLPRAKGDWRLGKEKFAKKLEHELNAGV